MGIGEISRRAVFLDRDGVINASVLNSATGEYEAPKRAEDFALLPGVPEALKRLQKAEFLLFLVSNQPDFAKGKASMEALAEVHQCLLAALAKHNITFAAFYYCYHHPDYAGPCVCRKPSPYFLLQAKNAFHVAMQHSWMVGDRETDVQCGQAAGVHTVRVAEQGEQTMAEFIAADLLHAADIMLQQ